MFFCGGVAAVCFFQLVCFSSGVLPPYCEEVFQMLVDKCFSLAVGDVLRERNWQFKDMAAAVGVTPPMVSRWLKGKVKQVKPALWQRLEPIIGEAWRRRQIAAEPTFAGGLREHPGEYVCPGAATKEDCLERSAVVSSWGALSSDEKRAILAICLRAKLGNGEAGKA
jgi:transcriptional regulator with XRE-family HTH domain